MKNFPSALIRQLNTKQGIGNNIGTTLANIGQQSLQNILGGQGSSNKLKGLSEVFERGYEILEIPHEISKISINQYDGKGDDDINQLIKIRSTDESNFSLKANYDNGKDKINQGIVDFEDPFAFSSTIFSTINNYKYILPNRVPSIIDTPMAKDPDKKGAEPEIQMSIIETVTSPSLFNPYNAVSFNGITETIPLIIDESNGIFADKGDTVPFDIETGLSQHDEDNLNEENKDYEQTDQQNPTIQNTTILNSLITRGTDITDCTIRTLVNLSKKDDELNELGAATYRYIDFMFCKDLGKISNNHLITLRRFPGPVNDNIFKNSRKGKSNTNGKESITDTYHDIGRLITWFGTDDNKLEDICKYDYQASWEPMTAERDKKASEQSDEGLVNQIANAFSPSNNKLVASGFSSNYGLLQMGANKLRIPFLKDKSPKQYYSLNLLMDYDKHRIYTPKDRIWDTHMYKGKLTFNQNINLTFKYKLRSYSNINPKTAFLDLIANILVVTYKRGSFWGGENIVVGGQGNNSVYRTAEAWLEKGAKALGGIWRLLSSGGLSLQAIQGWLQNIWTAAGEYLGDAMEKAQDVLGTGDNNGNNNSNNSSNNSSNGSGNNNSNGSSNSSNGNDNNNGKNKVSKAIEKSADIMESLNSKYHFTDAIKGMFRNQLGRPAIYAFNSILTGEPVGPWHLTIGNPRNPIMSIGNLILMNAEIQHSGPLGLDDFPTELKVTVTLKHGRPRDSVEIQKMYTRGESSIYKPMNLVNTTKYFYNEEAFGDITLITKGSDADGNKHLRKLLRNV